MLAYDHDHFFQGRVAGPFAETVDRTFYLPCPGNNSCNGIGGSETEIIMTMTGNNRFIYIAHVIDKPGNFFSVLMRQTVSGGVGNINHGSSGFYNSFDHTG